MAGDRGMETQEGERRPRRFVVQDEEAFDDDALESEWGDFFGPSNSELQAARAGELGAYGDVVLEQQAWSGRSVNQLPEEGSLPENLTNSELLQVYAADGPYYGTTLGEQREVPVTLDQLLWEGAEKGMNAELCDLQATIREITGLLGTGPRHPEFTMHLNGLAALFSDYERTALLFEQSGRVDEDGQISWDPVLDAEVCDLCERVLEARTVVDLMLGLLQAPAVVAYAELCQSVARGILAGVNLVEANVAAAQAVIDGIRKKNEKVYAELMANWDKTVSNTTKAVLSSKAVSGVVSRGAEKRFPTPPQPAKNADGSLKLSTAQEITLAWDGLFRVERALGAAVTYSEVAPNVLEMDALTLVEKGGSMLGAVLAETVDQMQDKGHAIAVGMTRITNVLAVLQAAIDVYRTGAIVYQLQELLDGIREAEREYGPLLRWYNEEKGRLAELKELLEPMASAREQAMEQTYAYESALAEVDVGYLYGLG